MELLSIQSSVAFGHVGNSAAIFPLQRLGIEAWAVNTVHFSNHTGYGDWRGPLLSAEELRGVIQGVEERGVLPRLAAVLSGYQGAEEVGAVVLETVERVKQLNPQAIYCCDPVMGDVGRGMFVRPGIPEFMRDHVVPSADVITPNHFELDFLAGRRTRTLSEVLDAAEEIRSSGPSTVLVTSVLTTETPEGWVDVVAVGEHGAWCTRTPLLPLAPNGCGDLTAAVFLAHLLRTGSVDVALEKVTATVFGVLEKTLAAGHAERSSWSRPKSLIADPPARFAPGARSVTRGPNGPPTWARRASAFGTSIRTMVSYPPVAGRYVGMERGSNRAGIGQSRHAHSG